MLFLILVVFVAIFIGGCVSKIETGITYNEPAGWEKFTFGGMITYQHPSDSDTFIQFIPETEKEKDFRIDDWEENIRIDQENCDRLKVVKIDNFTVNNLQASEYIGECELGGKILMTRYVVIVKDNQYALFTLATTKKDYDKNNAIFNKVLNSIVWK